MIFFFFSYFKQAHCATNGLFIGGKQAELDRNAAEAGLAGLPLSAVEITCSFFSL